MRHILRYSENFAGITGDDRLLREEGLVGAIR